MTAANRGLQCIPDVHPSLLSQEQFSDLVQQPALLHASGLIRVQSVNCATEDFMAVKQERFRTCWARSQ